jgi:hypothetical protein
MKSGHVIAAAAAVAFVMAGAPAYAAVGYDRAAAPAGILQLAADQGGEFEPWQMRNNRANDVGGMTGTTQARPTEAGVPNPIGNAPSGEPQQMGAKQEGDPAAPTEARPLREGDTKAPPATR